MLMDLKKNPDDEGSSGYCSGFEGNDVCGPDPSPIHYTAMSCTGTENNIMDCYREMAEGCTH
jgi:hypothetical protein